MDFLSILKSILFVIVFSNLKCGKCREQLYSVELQEFEVLPETDKEFGNFQTLRITKLGRNSFALSGEFEIFKNMGNEYQVYYVVYMNGNSPVNVVHTEKLPICAMISGHMQTYAALRNFSNFPPGNECPFRKGQYKIEDFQITADSLPAIIPYGEVTVFFYVILGDEVKVGCKLLGTIGQPH